jgi:hypothetical protein
MKAFPWNQERALPFRAEIMDRGEGAARDGITLRVKGSALEKVPPVYPDRLPDGTFEVFLSLDMLDAMVTEGMIARAAIRGDGSVVHFLPWAPSDSREWGRIYRKCPIMNAWFRRYSPQQRMGIITRIDVEDVTCADCIAEVAEVLARVPSVESCGPKEESP